MVLTLHKATEMGALDQPFSFCDHATGTHSTTACYQTKVAEDQRRLYTELDFFAALFDEDEKKLYDALQEKAFTFFDRRASSEQDLSGSMRGIFQTEWEFEQRQSFLDTLKKLETQTLKLSHKDSIKAQKEMDQLYAETIHSLKIETEKRTADGMSPIIEVEDVGRTQKEWIHFQEAFTAFAAKRYPKMNQDHFKAWLFEQRIEQLNELLIGL